jgi:hypothetical protein
VRHSSPHIIRVIKSVRQRLAGHVARIVGGRCVQGYGLESLERRGHLEVLGVDRRIIVEWIDLA